MKFRETATVESQSCRDAFGNKGKLEVRGRIYPAVIGSTSSHHDFLAGNLDDSNNCEDGQFQDAKTKKRMDIKWRQEWWNKPCSANKVKSMISRAQSS